MLPERVRIREVGLRDGLQSEKNIVPTEKKLALLQALTAAGIRELEVTSFVSAGAVPQMADAPEVMSSLVRLPGVVYSALVVNGRGAQNAIAAGTDELQLVVSCSEQHSQKNVKMSIAGALDQASRIAALAQEAGKPVRAALATAFGCPYEGPVAAETVLNLVEKLGALGISRFTLADTAGMANPRQVHELCRKAMAAFPGYEFALHLHDKRGFALACVITALDAGITVFESSVAGLGGCPFIPRAAGNVATEDLVLMLEEMGVSTGIEQQALLKAAFLAQDIVGRDLCSHRLHLTRICQQDES